MQKATAASSDRRTQVHTEVRAPIEAILTRVTWFVFGAIETIIAVRFVLRLVGANASSGFVELVHAISGAFMAPFESILSTQRVSGATFEWSALVAIAVYALIAWGLVALIAAVTPRTHAETIQRVESDEDVVVE